MEELVKKDIVTYKHMANAGDMIGALPGLKYVYDQLGKKAVIFQRMNVPAEYYQNAKHPIKDKDGVQVTMNFRQFEMLKPLLEAQEYIERVEVWEGQEVDVNLDKIREGDFSTMGFGSLARWQFYTHPYLACDLSKPWISVPTSEGIRWPELIMEDSILLNFTSRYRNPLITYYFLKEWEDKLIFAGLPEEHEKFCEENKLKMPLLIVKDFLELTQAIQACKFVLCCQSLVWNICDAIKKKRVLEVCRSASNCVPNGPDGYDFLQQGAAEFYVKKFMKQ
jgi:hypothetical protein